MAIPKKLSTDPYAILHPEDRWRPGKQDRLRKQIGHLFPPLVDKLRRAVKEWRDQGYPVASDTTRALLSWWFDRTPNNEKLIRYYFSQREAVETVIYLYEVVAVRDKYDLLRFSSDNALNWGDETWRRFVIKMATGSGKTKVMSLLIAWSYFHKCYELDSTLSRNFLLIAPNIIVLDRLYRDFQNLQIFHEDKVLPPDGHAGRDWRAEFQMRLHKQNEVRAHSGTGNLFLTNIQRVYVHDNPPPSADDDNTSDYFLGAQPHGELNAGKIDLGEVVRKLDELLIINDEAHHIHDKKLAWFKSIEDIHGTFIQKGCMLSLQVDMTATPKHNNGAIFAQIVTDYPLVEAIHQNVVKCPVIPDDESERKMKERTSSDYAERYADYIELGVKEWRKAREMHKRASKKAILFVMTDDTKNCDALGKHLENTYHDLKGKVLVIHTKNNGAIAEKTKHGKDEQVLRQLRDQAASIDGWDNKFHAVVSVLVLREGWDVRNVTTVVGLRAYSAKSNILPEQTLGRGIRLMYPERNDTGEKVSVIGSPAFANFVKQIEKEGVKLERSEMGDTAHPQTSMIVAIDRDNPAKNIAELEITVPIFSRRFFVDYSNLKQLTADIIDSTPQPYKKYPPSAPRKIRFCDVLKDKFSHATNLDDYIVGDHSRVIGFFLSRIMSNHNLFSNYDLLYEVTRDFIRDHLFGKQVDLDAEDTLRNLAEPSIGKAITEALNNAISKLLTAQKEQLEVLGVLKVSDMYAFAAKPRADQYSPTKCAQNIIISDNSKLELKFAQFLDECPDVSTFAKNYFAVNFRLEYVRSDGKIANYFPDFLVRNQKGELWVVETKGREDENDRRKYERLQQWCEDVSSISPDHPVFSLMVREADYYDCHRAQTFAELVACLRTTAQTKLV